MKLISALSTLTLVPLLASAAPLKVRQAPAAPGNATFSSTISLPTNGSSIERGPSGILTVELQPGSEAIWFDVELLHDDDDNDDDDDQDDDLDSHTLVRGWTSENSTVETMRASFRLVDEDDDSDDQDDLTDDIFDDLPCDSTVYLRVTEYTLNDSNISSARSSRVPLTLTCPEGFTPRPSSSNSAAAPTRTDGPDGHDDTDDGPGEDDSDDGPGED